MKTICKCGHVQEAHHEFYSDKEGCLICPCGLFECVAVEEIAVVDDPWNDVRKDLPAYGKEVIMSDGKETFVGWRDHTDSTGEHWLIKGAPDVISDADDEFSDVILWMDIPPIPERVEDPSDAN